jgi:hypothetical protein
MTMDLEDLTVSAFPFDTEQFLAFRRRAFPAGLVPLVISRANGIHIFRAAQDLPTWFFFFPEVSHPCPVFGNSCRATPLGRIPGPKAYPFLLQKGR